MALSKLAKFRSKLRDLNLHKFLVFSNDAHASEYVCPADGKFFIFLYLRSDIITVFSGL